MNPLQMINAFKNPQAFVQGMMNNSQVMNNPMARNAMEMYKKGDMQGLQNMAQNLAKERGTSVEDVRNSIMQHFGMQ